MYSIDWLKKLISFDTTSYRSNIECMTAISDWLSYHHIEHAITYNDTQEKMNMFATLPAKNGNKNHGIILSGHTDVVPIDGQQWNTNPFEAVISEKKLYGRGASDMKGFIAVILALIPAFKKISLEKPLYFAFSYDEEVGCLGVPKILDDIEQRGIFPIGCVVGEPTDMKPVTAHKGINVFRCRIEGYAIHSSLTAQGCNAIEYAARLISWINEYATQLSHGEQDSCYDVAYTTLTTNKITGGNALNIIPSFCEFFFEFRNLPSVKPNQIIQTIQSYANNELLPLMQKQTPQAKITIESVASVPAYEISEDMEITKWIRELTQEKKIRKVSYATEAGLFQKANIPTIICGPGSIKQAHTANEYIELEQLVQCEIFLKQLVQSTLC